MTGGGDRTDPTFGETVGAFVMGAVVWGLIEKGGGAAVFVALVLNAWLHQPWTQTLLTACLWLLLPYAVGWGLFAVSEMHRTAAAQRPPGDLPRTPPLAPAAAPRQEPSVPLVTPRDPAQPAHPPGVDAVQDRDWLDPLPEEQEEQPEGQQEQQEEQEQEHDEQEVELDTVDHGSDYWFGDEQPYRLSAIRDVIGAHRPWRPGETVVVVADAHGRPLIPDDNGVVTTRGFTVLAYASPEALESGADPVERSTAESLLHLQEVAARMRRPPSTSWGFHDIP